MLERVVVTGLGIVSCLGNDADSVRQSLFDGRSGISLRQDHIDAGMRSQIAGTPRLICLNTSIGSSGALWAMPPDTPTSVCSRRLRKLTGLKTRYPTPHGNCCRIGGLSASQVEAAMCSASAVSDVWAPIV